MEEEVDGQDWCFSPLGVVEEGNGEGCQSVVQFFVSGYGSEGILKVGFVSCVGIFSRCRWG